jgi:arylsulfatase A-like enzyme
MTLRGHWPFLARILALMLFITIGTKIGRVFVDGLPEGGYSLLSWLTLLRPEILLSLGTVALGAGLMGVLKGRTARGIGAAGFLVLVIIVVTMEIVGLCHQVMVGDVGFDLEILIYFLPRTATMIQVIASEAPWWLWIAVAGFIALFPVAYFNSRPWRTEGARGWRQPAGMALGGMLLIVLAAIPPAYPKDGRAAGSTTLTFITQAYRSWADQPDGIVNTAGFFAPDIVLAADEAAKATPPNVIVIVLESTRASGTSVVGAVPTTPVLKELGRHALVAEHAYTTMPHTSKALVSIFCGVAPLPAVPVVESQPGNMPTRCLPGLLAEQGYRTAFFQSATGQYEGRGALVANMGFKEFHPAETLPEDGFERVNYFAIEDDAMLQPVQDWVSKSKGPFFLGLLTGTSHHDYHTPSTFQTEHYVENETYNRYLNTVRYTDRFVGRLLAELKADGALDNTIIVVVGDHGEGFGEHGSYAHNTVIYDEGIHVPLIIQAPGLAPGRLAAPVNHLDIMPTVVDLLGFTPEGGTFEGNSLVRPLPERRIKAHCWYNRDCMAVMQGRWKLIDHFGSQPEELFDLAADPGETRNIIAQHAAMAAAMKADLVQWRQVANAAWRNNISSDDRFEDLSGVLHFRQAMADQAGAP